MPNASPKLKARLKTLSLCLLIVPLLAMAAKSKKSNVLSFSKGRSTKRTRRTPASWRAIEDAAEVMDGRPVILRIPYTGLNGKREFVKQYGEWCRKSEQWVTPSGDPIRELYGEPTFWHPDIGAPRKKKSSSIACSASASAGTAKTKRNSGISSRGRQLTDAELQSVLRLRADKVSIRKISDQLDITKSAVKRIIKRAA